MVIHCHASFLGYAVISCVPACEQVPAATYDNTAGYRLGNGGKLGLNGPKMHNMCKNKIRPEHIIHHMAVLDYIFAHISAFSPDIKGDFPIIGGAGGCWRCQEDWMRACSQDRIRGSYNKGVGTEPHQ